MFGDFCFMEAAAGSSLASISIKGLKQKSLQPAKYSPSRRPPIKTQCVLLSHLNFARLIKTG